MVEALELGVDFVAELGAEAWAEVVEEAGPSGVVAEGVAVIDEAWDFGWFEGGASADEGEVESDAEGGALLGEADGVVSGGCVDHEAGGGEDPVLVGA